MVLGRRDYPHRYSSFGIKFRDMIVMMHQRGKEYELTKINHELPVAHPNVHIRVTLYPSGLLENIFPVVHLGGLVG